MFVSQGRLRALFGFMALLTTTSAIYAQGTPLLEIAPRQSVVIPKAIVVPQPNGNDSPMVFPLGRSQAELPNAGDPVAPQVAQLELPPPDNGIPVPPLPPQFPVPPQPASPDGPTILEPGGPWPPLPDPTTPPDGIVTEESTPPWYHPHCWIRPVWDGSFELGINGSEGNSQSSSFRFGVDLERMTKSSEIEFDITHAQATANSTKTQNNVLTNARYERLYGDSPWTFFVKGSGEYDQFKALSPVVGSSSI